MFGFFRKRSMTPRPCPERLAANPAIDSTFRLGRADGSSVEFDLVPWMRKVLTGLGHKVVDEKTWLRLVDGDVAILPRFLDVEIRDDGLLRFVTTVQTHADVCRDGVFEFQHSLGPDPESALSTGFEQWARTDLVTLLSASKPTTRDCMNMVAEFPGGKRRAVFGPVAHFRTDEAIATGEEHPFCPCCLFTNSIDAFADLFRGGGCQGIRLYAAREDDGKAAADCRVNGVDFESGAEALRKYVETWPGRGLEFRKQYVVLHSL